jgi:hypothetical protein
MGTTHCRRHMIERYKNRLMLEALEVLVSQRLSKTPKAPFHGGNTGSNPVGDANVTEGGEKGRNVLHQ